MVAKSDSSGGEVTLVFIVRQKTRSTNFCHGHVTQIQAASREAAAANGGPVLHHVIERPKELPKAAAKHLSNFFP